MESLLTESPGGELSWRGKPVETVTYLLDRTDDDLKIPTVTAVKQAMLLQERGCRVAVAVRDLKVSATGMERLYRRARERGVLFFKYDEPPAITAVDNAINVDLEDTTQLSERITVSLPSDLIVVPETFTADPEAGELCRMLRLRPGADGRFMDDNPQFQRVLTNRRGIFLAGGCRFPQSSDRSVERGAGRRPGGECPPSRRGLRPGDAHRRGGSPEMRVCLSCLRLCPHAAIDVERSAGGETSTRRRPEKDNSPLPAGVSARVDPAACFGCGVCVAECPNRAITLY